jgi:hypothetical protein
MINASSAVLDPAALNVLEGVQLHGEINVEEAQLLANVRSAMRRPYPQIRPQPRSADRVALVGGGPSLNDTVDELVALIQGGAKLVALNGAYDWCLQRNLFPKMQIVMDARPTNARFLATAIPNCHYVLASQCAPEVWDAVEGRPNVWMFHAANGTDGPLKTMLDEHFLGNWFGVGGGTTVGTRAINLLRAIGHLRFDLFGLDSCFMGDEGHAYPQPENERDRIVNYHVHPIGAPGQARIFRVAPWHIKQLEDFLQLIRINGEHFVITAHGNGLLAYALAQSANVEWTTNPAQE